MACEPLTTESQRAITVRPGRVQPDELMAQTHEEAGDLEAEAMETGEAVVEKHQEEQIEWEDVQDKVEELTVRVARHFEDANDQTGWKPLMVKSQLQPTKE